MLCQWQFSLQSGKVEFFPQIQNFLIQVSAPPGGKSSIGFDGSQEVSKNVLQPKNSAAAAKVEHILYQRLEQDKSYRVWYWTLCRQETWAPTSWLLRCLLVTRAVGRMGSQEKEKLRIRTKKWSPQDLRARQTGTNTVRECILIPTTKVTTT